MKLLQINHIGSHTTIPGWPEPGTIAGLLDALGRWKLDPRLNKADAKEFEPHPDRKPYRYPALRYGGSCWSAAKGHTIYLDGPPMFPEAPDAVCFLGNFVGYSFAFHLSTNDRDLIQQLDAAITKNMECS